MLYESLGIELSLTPLEMETVFWDAASIGAMMPETDKMLEYLRENGIRTAVISNLMWSGEALTRRLNRLLPENQFEFVMTSSDYLVRKPNTCCLKSHCKRPVFAGKRSGIAAIIRKRILKAPHRWASIPSGMTMIWKKGIGTVPTKAPRSVSMFIFISGAKCWIYWKR